jgi:hypothetical protein
MCRINNFGANNSSDCMRSSKQPKRRESFGWLDDGQVANSKGVAEQASHANFTSSSLHILQHNASLTLLASTRQQGLAHNDSASYMFQLLAPHAHRHGQLALVCTLTQTLEGERFYTDTVAATDAKTAGITRCCV